MKNRLLWLSLILLCVGSHINAQEQSNKTCFKRDHVKNYSLKSNSLTQAQIAASENYDVHFYALDIAMNNLVTTLSGNAEIHAKTKTTLDSALFELFPTLTITQIRVNNNPVTYSRVGSAIKVPVNLSSGQNFIISIDYNGTPPTAATNPLGGSGMTNASSPSWGNRVTWSLSEPFSAYEWWPCKQSLTDKADSCSVKITVPNACKAGSNGVLENIVDLGNGTSRYEWKHRHPIDYYLISVAVAEYVEYNVYANPVGAPAPILIQNFVYNNPNTLLNFQTQIDETASFLELFSDLFGMYPFADEKYGHCMAPLSGGMEHQTMTTQGWFEKGLTAHELGHQWWGNHVTCASWADIWINEGFASYSEYLMLENIYPTLKNQHMTDVHTNVMSQNGGSVYCLDSLNDSRIFSGRLTYDKGAAIVHTMRYVMNNDNLFFQTLKNFQQQFADSVAKGIDFQSALEFESGIDYSQIFDQWYFGEGYPTYSARWNNTGNDLHLEITHTTSMPAITPTFTNPLDIRFSRAGLPDTIIRFSIDANTNMFFVPNVGVINNLVSFDPNNWVINKTGTKVKDVNFFASIEEASLTQINLYPNPANTTLNVSHSSNLVNSYEIHSMEGKKIVSNVASGQNISVPVNSLAKGTYLLVLKSSSNVVARSFFVKD